MDVSPPEPPWDPLPIFPGKRPFPLHPGKRNSHVVVCSPHRCLHCALPSPVCMLSVLTLPPSTLLRLLIFAVLALCIRAGHLTVSCIPGPSWLSQLFAFQIFR